MLFDMEYISCNFCNMRKCRGCQRLIPDSDKRRQFCNIECRWANYERRTWEQPRTLLLDAQMCEFRDSLLRHAPRWAVGYALGFHAQADMTYWYPPNRRFISQ